jgi:hypothetical protein
MNRVDPGDPFDGRGWGRISVGAGGRVETDYMMWRKDVLGVANVDSGCGDNGNQVLTPRLADKEWPYYGGYK